MTTAANITVTLQIERDGFTLNADFSAPATGVTAISGPSGSGKTTLLRAIAGLDYANGQVRIGTTTWQDNQTFVPVHERRLGFVFQEASLFPHLNVRGNLAFGMPQSGRMEATSELLGLNRLLDRPTHNLSGGERQRVAIGRALLSQPRVLLMDEPLSSLDRRARHELMPYLERLHEELQIPVLYVSHAADEIARLADHVVQMSDGATVATGSVTDMLRRLDLPAAMLRATVTGIDQHYGLCELSCDTGRLYVSLPSADNEQVAATTATAIGRELRLHVLPRDVSLTLEAQESTSILNILPAEVTELVNDGGPRCLVHLRTGEQNFLAQITRKSADSLQLQPGARVFAQIKTVALLDDEIAS